MTELNGWATRRSACYAARGRWIRGGVLSAANDAVTRTWRDGRRIAIAFRVNRRRRPRTRVRTITMANSVTTDRTATASSAAAASTSDTLTVIDNRTGKQYQLPIKD